MADPNIVEVDPGSIELGGTEDTSNFVEVDPSSIRVINSPYDDKTAINDYQRIGIGPDKTPIRNVQAVDQFTRWATQFAFDNAKEKAAYLRSKLGKDWDIANHPTNPTDVIIKKRGDKQWGVIDPGQLTLDELIPEMAEHVDTISQVATLPSGILSGGLTAASIQGIRQGIKQALLPGSDPNIAQIAIDGASGMIGAGVTKGITSAVKRGSQEASNLAGKGIQKIAGEGGYLEKVGDKLRILDQPESIAKEIGASAKEMEPLGQKLLVGKIATLQKDHPEFKAAYDSAFRMKDKFTAVNDLLEKTGAELGDIYSDAPINVAVKDIFSTEPAQLLKEAVNSRVVKQGNKLIRVNGKTQAQIKNVQHDFLEDIATTVIGDSKSGQSYLKLFRQNRLHKDPDFKAMGIKDNNEAMLALIGEHDISLQDLVMTRWGREGIVKYGKQKGQISAKNSVDKYTADALRDTIHSAIRDNLGEAGEDAIKKMELFSNLYPVVKRMSATIGGEAAKTWNPVGKVLPSWLNSAPRYAAKLGVNLSNLAEVRTLVRSMTEGASGAIPKQVTGSASALPSITTRLAKGIKFRLAQDTLEKSFLPRDAEAFFENPDLINNVVNQLGDPELTDSMVKQFERGDKEGFANTLSMVASENDELFEKAPYKSLVVQNGQPVLMDKFDREQYRQHIEKSIIDPREKYKALQALNGNNVMVKAPYDIPQSNTVVLSNKQSKKLSTSSRVASQLKDFETVEMDDGTERVDHDY